MTATVLEWWPDYGFDHPLCAARGPEGAPAELGSLELPVRLAERLREWTAMYPEDKIPVDGDGDASWLAEGVGLLGEVRACLGDGYRVVVTEPWWGEEPSA